MKTNVWQYALITCNVDGKEVKKGEEIKETENIRWLPNLALFKDIFQWMIIVLFNVSTYFRCSRKYQQKRNTI
jgi:hypothetical protein